MTFLEHLESRPLSEGIPAGLRPVGLFLGQGAMGLEVAVLEGGSRPGAPALRAFHHDRTGSRATPVVVVGLWGEGRGAIVGPRGDDLEVVLDADAAQLERICEAALGAPDRHAARRFLNTALDQLGAPVPGLRNAGLFALHELQHGVPKRPDWAPSGEKAQGLMRFRARELIEGLGYSIRTSHGPWSVLVRGSTKVAVAIFLERPDEIEPASPRFDNVSPVSFALAKADQENLDYVVVSAGSTVRIYPVKPGVGTGRRGRSETFVELNLDLLRTTDAGYLWLLCSADALASGGTFEEILETSADFAADLGARLRDRVYNEVVPRLAQALVHEQAFRPPTAEKVRDTYDMALHVLFRMLFVAYAEDKELLPLHSHREYRKHSLKEMALRLAEAIGKGTDFEEEDYYWTEVAQLWKAIDKGNRGWGVPAYDGGLFASDEGGSRVGAALTRIKLPDKEFVPAFAALVLDETQEGQLGPVDFRSLGVREFGTIYEGLLDSELSVAEVDLAVDPKTQAYLPAKGKAKVVVSAGGVYLHNASGARKSSGAYYTKSFAVEHLLDRALEPALDDHLARLDAMYDKRDRATQFFDFHIADIAMGSGHFLVAAIDRIERKFSNYLTRNPLPGVSDELERLRKSAVAALGPQWAGDPIEDAQLLRRQIARRCIFGVDLNPLAVELARLSIWIHTFVPGLPLSFLNHNLVVGNSLVGIATFEEASELLGAGSGDLFSFTAGERLQKAREPIERLGRLAEATAAEVREARKLYERMREAVRSEENLLTVLAASRIEPSLAEAVKGGQVATRLQAQGDVFSDALVRKAERALAGLEPLHFPVAFPQVFLGKRAGFDVIIGNPPWEKAHVEEHEFWARHFPGFRGTSQAERERQLPRLRRARPDLVVAFDAERERTDRLREVLTTGPYPGMGSGHPDLYKAFCWRFWHLVHSEGGQVGVVLPRATFAAKGSEEFRKALFADDGSLDLTMLLNTRGWVFDNAEPRYTIALVAIRRGRSSRARSLAMRGPFSSLQAYRAGMVAEPAEFGYTAVRSWSSALAVPLLPRSDSTTVFTRMRRSPQFSEAGGERWLARPLQGDLNASLGRPFMDFEAKPSRARWPVYAGESFDLWTPDTGRIYAVAEANRLCDHLQERRRSSARQQRSAFHLFDEVTLQDPRTLPCRAARVAFRDVSRATDTRTVRVALVPPGVFLTHTAPYLLWPRGDVVDQAFVLGVMSSVLFDWFARRFVETHLTFDVLAGLPVPEVPDEASRERIAKLSTRLAAQDDRFASWAAMIRLEPARMASDEQDELIAELDAAVATLYGLAEADLVHVFETFHEGWDYEEGLRRTLKHYNALKAMR